MLGWLAVATRQGVVMSSLLVEACLGREADHAALARRMTERQDPPRRSDLWRRGEARIDV